MISGNTSCRQQVKQPAGGSKPIPAVTVFTDNVYVSFVSHYVIMDITRLEQSGFADGVEAGSNPAGNGMQQTWKSKHGFCNEG